MKSINRKERKDVAKDAKMISQHNPFATFGF